MRSEGDVRVQKATDCRIDIEAGEDDDDAELQFGLRKATAAAAADVEKLDEDYDADYGDLPDNEHVEKHEPPWLHDAKYYHCEN